MKEVNINYDLSKYLPSDSSTRIGMQLMDKEFGSEKLSTLNIMFLDLSKEDKHKIYVDLKSINGIADVSYEEDSEKSNKDNYTLYRIKVNDLDSSTISKTIYNDVVSRYQDNYKFCFLFTFLQN